MSKQNISVTLKKFAVKAIDQLTAPSNRPRSWFFEQALALHLNDLYDAQQALRRLRDFQDRTINPKQLRNRLGI